MPTPIDFTLLTRYLGDQCSPGERQRVDEWRRHSPENERYLDHLQRVWRASGPLPDEPVTDTGQAWLQLREKMEEIRPLAPQRPVAPTRTLYAWLPRVAAVLLLAVGLGLLGQWLLRRGAGRAANLVEVKAGQQPRRLVLADGSRVWLNRHSTLRYPKAFGPGEARELALTGEGYFEVVPDPARPFLVHTGNLVTKVLGTAFALRAYRPDSLVALRVTSGKVTFYPEAQVGDGVRLLANEQAVFAGRGGPIAKGAITDPNFLAWQTGRLSFRNAPLAEVVRTLSEYYGRSLVLAGAGLASCRLTAEFRSEGLPEVLETLRLTHGLGYREAAGEVRLDGPGCGGDQQP